MLGKATLQPGAAVAPDTPAGVVARVTMNAQLAPVSRNVAAAVVTLQSSA